MKGRDRFTSAEADEVRSLLDLVRNAEPGRPRKLLRDQLRAVGFYISDFAAALPASRRPTSTALSPAAS
jgi:hypothetical protein